MTSISFQHTLPSQSVSWGSTQFGACLVRHAVFLQAPFLRPTSPRQTPPEPAREASDLTLLAGALEDAREVGAKGLAGLPGDP
eukprot:1724855-Alexandrium_andersonii.AAC.1